MKGFSYGKIVMLGSGFFAISIVWMIYNTFMPLILGEFIESKTLRGAIMGLDNLLALFLIPFIGAWSDRMDSKLGQRLPFIVVGMPIAAILFMLLPFSREALWSLIILDIVFLLSMTVFRAPVISLMPDHTPPDKRSSANGVINLMGGIAALLALFVVGKLYDVNNAYPFWISGAVMLLGFFFLYNVVDRRPPYAGTTADETERLESFTKGLTQLRKPEFRGHLLVLIAIFLYFIGYAGVEAQFSTYAVEHLGTTPGEASFTLGFFSLSFVLFALPAGFIGDKLGKARTMRIGLVLMPTAFVLIPFFTSLAVIKGLLFLGGVAWALINVQAYPLVADLGGKNKIGLFTGMYYFFSMGSSIIAPALLGFTMDFIDYRALYFTGALAVIIGLLFLNKGVAELQRNRVNDNGLSA